MKTMKRIAALVLALVMVLAMGIVAFADAPANGTITITNATIGKDYAAYKIFDATVDGNGNIAYTYAGTLPANDYFTKDSVGNVTATAAATDANGKLTSGAIAFLGTLKGTTPVASTEATSDTVVFSDLPFGYYYITSELGTAVTVTSTNPTASVIDKNQTSSLDKNIIIGYNQDGTPILSKISNVNVGDKIPYQIRIDAVNYDGEKYITNYYVYDKMNQALTFNDDIKVTVNGTELAAGSYGIAYGTSADDYNFKLNIPWVDNTGAFLYNKTNSVILVTYTATVNEKISVTGAMENTAEYNYNSVPTVPDKPKPNDDFINPDPAKPKKITKSYSTELEICKVDDQGNALTGAKFSIKGFSSDVVIVNEEIFVPYVAAAGETQPTAYYMLKNGQYTVTAPVLEDTYVPVASDYDRNQGGYVKTGDNTYREALESELKDSSIALYILVHANVDQYDADNINNKFMKIEKITKDTSVAKPVEYDGWVDANGKLVFKGLGEGEYTITELVAPNGFNLLKYPITVKVTFDTANEQFKAQVSTLNTEVVANGGKISFNVVNTPGSELPETGGIGTKLFYVFGSILLVGAAVLLITKKRVSVEG